MRVKTSDFCTCNDPIGVTLIERKESIMKCVKIMIVGLAIALLMVGCMLSKRNVVEPKPQTICPVMGGTINKAVYTDYEGKRVYFCWRSCINIFQKDPAKYVKNLEDEGVTLEEASKTVNKNMSSRY